MRLQADRTDHLTVCHLERVQLTEAAQHLVKARLVYHTATEIERLHVVGAVKELVTAKAC